MADESAKPTQKPIGKPTSEAPPEVSAEAPPDESTAPTLLTCGICETQSLHIHRLAECVTNLLTAKPLAAIKAHRTAFETAIDVANRTKEDCLCVGPCLGCQRADHIVKELRGYLAELAKSEQAMQDPAYAQLRRLATGMYQPLPSSAPTRMPGYDAREWVKFWRETITQHPSIPYDDGAMLGWFANAIMAGYDEYPRRQATNQPSAPDERADAALAAGDALLEQERK
jgi:hypothetical protein